MSTRGGRQGGSQRRLPVARGLPTRPDAAQQKTEREQERHEKVFTIWASNLLSAHGMELTNICDDFRDGIKLMKLAEILTGEQLPRPQASDRSVMHRVANIQQALDAFKAHGVNTDGIFAQDIAAQANRKAVLALVWKIVVALAVDTDAGLGNKDQLLQWARQRTQDHPNVAVHNLHSSWMDGMALCALIHSYYPDKLDMSKVDPADPQHNVRLGIDTARAIGLPFHFSEKELLGPPPPDERTITTMVATLYNILETNPGTGRTALQERRDALTSDGSRVDQSTSSSSPRRAPRSKQGPFDTLRLRQKRNQRPKVNFDADAMNQGVPEAKLQTLRKIFDTLDTDSTGRIGMGDVADLVKDHLGMNVLSDLSGRISPDQTEQLRKMLSSKDMLASEVAEALGTTASSEMSFPDFVQLMHITLDDEGNPSDSTNILTAEGSLLSKALAAVLSEREQLRTTVSQLESELHTKEDEIHKLAENYHRDVSEAQDAQDSRALAVERERNTLQATVQRLERELAGATQAASDAGAAAKALAALEAKLQAKDDELAQLQADYSALQEEQQDRTRRDTRRQNELEETLADLQQQLATAQQSARDAAIEQELAATHVASAKDFQAENRQLRQQLRELSDRLAEREAQLTDDSSLGNKALSNGRQAMPSLEDELTASNTAGSGATQRQLPDGGDERDKELTRLQRRVRELEHELNEAAKQPRTTSQEQSQRSKAALADQLGKMEAALRDKEKQLALANRKLDSQERMITGLKDDATDHRNKISTLRASNDQLRMENERLRKAMLERPPSSATPSRSKLTRPGSQRQLPTLDEDKLWRAIQELRNDQNRLSAEGRQAMEEALSALSSALSERLADAAEQRSQLEQEIALMRAAIDASRELDSTRAAIMDAMKNGRNGADEGRLVALQDSLTDARNELQAVLQELEALQQHAHVEVHITREVVHHRQRRDGSFDVVDSRLEGQNHVWFTSPEVDKILSPELYPWNAEEDGVIAEMLDQGDDVLEVARNLPGRTDTAILARYADLKGRPPRPRRPDQMAVPVTAANKADVERANDFFKVQAHPRRRNVDRTASPSLLLPDSAFLRRDRRVRLDNDLSYATKWAESDPYLRRLQRLRHIEHHQQRSQLPGSLWA